MLKTIYVREQPYVHARAVFKFLAKHRLTSSSSYENRLNQSGEGTRRFWR
jgi:hypothetical protein